MITQVHIKNFQSHADTVVNLSPTVTVFTGDSDQGKTAIFRALRKIFRNVPAGNFFIRWGEEVCDIEIVIDDVRILRRVSSKGKNLYKVGKDEYNKFNRDIPEEVKQALHISDMQLFGVDKLDFNIQSQHNDLFMVGGTGVSSLRGKIFCKVTGSEKINNAVTVVNSEALEANRQSKAVKLTLDGLENKVASYNYLEDIKDLKASLDKDIERLRVLIREVDSLSEISKEVNDISSNMLLIRGRLKSYESIDLAYANQLSFELESVANLYSQLQLTEHNINTLMYTVGLEVNVDFDSVDTLISECAQIKKIQQQAVYFKEEWTRIRNKKQEKEQQLTNKTQELEEYKSTLGLCPTCDRPFETVSHNH